MNMFEPGDFDDRNIERGPQPPMWLVFGALAVFWIVVSLIASGVFRGR